MRDKIFIVLALTACSVEHTSEHLTPMCGDPPVDAVPPPPPPPSIALNKAWPRHTIYNTALKGADGVHMADINGDGLLDLTTGWEQSAKTTVHYHPGCAAAKQVWPSTTLPGTTSGVEDAVFGDVDRDGRMDVVSSGSSNLRLYVHFANAAGWSFISINAAANVQRFLKSVVVDIDGDGLMEIVAGGYSTNASIDIYSSRTPRDPASWTRRVIGPVGVTFSLNVVDVDKDGDLDILLSDRDGAVGRPELKGSRWLENTGTAWLHRSISNVGGTRWLTATADHRTIIDGAWMPTAPTKMAIRTSSDRMAWTSTALPTLTGTGEYSAAAYEDIDQDGYDDIVLTFSHADGDKTGVVWLKGPTWERGEIGGPEGEKYDNLLLVDVDCDGDLDVVTNEQGRKGDATVVPLGNVWYENPLTVDAVME